MDDELDSYDDLDCDPLDLDYTPYTCMHGMGDNCDDCDAILEACGGTDKCLNCGRYKAGSKLNKDQMCKAGCINPAEY